MPSIAVCALVPEDDIVAHALDVENVVVDDPHETDLTGFGRRIGARGSAAALPAAFLDFEVIGTVDDDRSEPLTW